MFCKFCGNIIDDDALFCAKCGKKQENTEKEEDAKEKKIERPARSVGWATAIKNCFLRIFDYSGRSVRSEYWWLQLTGSVVGFVAYELFSTEFYLIIVIIFTLIGLPCEIRRLHDTGKSGWYSFISLIPLIGFFLLLYQLCKDSDGDNQWGLSPYEPPKKTNNSEVPQGIVHKWVCKCGNVICKEPCKFCGYSSEQKEKASNGYVRCWGCGAIVKEGNEKCHCGCKQFDVAPEYKKCEYCGKIVPVKTERCECGCMAFKES